MDSDSDVPDLVPSSSDEEDIKKPVKNNAECVDTWLSKNIKFLEKQEQNLRLFSIGPFIMGLETFITKPWMYLMYEAGMMDETRLKEKIEFTKLTDDEWKDLDIVDLVCKLVIKKMRKKKFLLNTIDMIDKIEELKKTGAMDVKKSIQYATKFSHIIDNVWDKALKYTQLKDKTEKVKFSTLYVCKLCQMMISSLARDGKDLAEDFKKSIRVKSGGPEKAMSYKDQGNLQYSQQKYEGAIKFYTDAIKADPFNHLCYGNRAQAYQKLSKHYEALADGRRAVLMKPDWIKGYYRYSQAFLNTGRLSMAVAMNKKGLKICEKSKDNDKMLKELKDQSTRLYAERMEDIPDLSAFARMLKDEPCTDDCSSDLGPGKFKIVNVEAALKSARKSDEDVSVLVSSDEQDSSEEEPVSMKKQSKKKEDPKKQSANKESEKQASKPQQAEKGDNKQKSKKGQKGSQQEKENKSDRGSGGQMSGGKTTTGKTVKNHHGKIKPDNKQAELMEKYMAEGSAAYLDNLGKKAVSSYQKALDLLSERKPEELGLDDQDVAVLEYAYGVAEIQTGIYKHILDGIEKLKYVVETYKDIRLPLPYYGIGKAYITLNRFEEAVDPLNKCLKMANNLKLSVLTWPGSDKKIEESISNKLQDKVKHMLTLTKYPPQPDAICKLHTDKEDTRTVIFFSDPDFKGFVRITCFTSCTIEFHNVCWRDFKMKFGEKTNDKDVLDKPCPTPDCRSCIVKIGIFRQDSVMSKELVSEKSEQPAQRHKKPALKLPPSSKDKIEKKKEKKELRKQKKKEHREEVDDLDMPSTLRETIDINANLNHNSVIEDPSIANDRELVAVVKPESEEYKPSKSKSSKKKNKKKKDKGKQVLNVEVNFGDDSDKQLLGEDDVEDTPVAIVRPQIVSTEEDPIKQQKKKAFVPKFDPNDHVVQNLFSFFEDLLKAHGPLHIRDAKITTMVDDFPQDARIKIEAVGGLSKFLLQSTKFAMHGEIVCMREDAHKASKISRQQSESFASKASKLNDSNQTYFNKEENVKVSESKDSKPKENVSKLMSEMDSIDSVDMGLDDFNVTKKVTKPSCMDTLDDFDYPVGGPSKSKDYTCKIVDMRSEYSNVEKPIGGTEKTLSMDMDELDDIDLIPVTRKNRKKKANRGMDDLDDFDLNPSDSESVKEGTGVSDLESISSRDESFRIVGREKMDLNKLPIDNRNGKIDMKMEYSMSRSSSKSDVSERSDLSADWKSGKQKMPDVKIQQSSKSMWPSRNSPNTFGPIGSPIPAEKTEGRSESVNSVPPYSSYLGDQNGSLLLMDPTKAAERERFRIDSQFVQELVDKVMKEITFGKNFTEKERAELYKQVTDDIWADFKKSDKSSLKETIGYEYTTGKKSFNEEYMKNFYQKKTTDPTLTPQSETPSSLLYGNSSFSNNVSSNSGWPTTIGTQPGFSNFQSNTGTVSAYSSMGTANSLFAPLTTNSNSNDFSSPFSLPNTKPSNFFDNWSIGISVTKTSTFSTLSSSQPLNSFPSTHASVFSTANMKVEKAILAVVETRSVLVNTDPYEPLKEEFQRMKREYQLLQEDLASALTQKQELTSHLQELTHRYKAIEQELNQKTEVFGNERKSMQEKQDLLYLEWNHINQQLTQFADNEKQLKLKLASLEEEKQELLQQKARESVDIKSVEDNNRKQQEEFKTIYEKEKERATKAELELISMKKQSAVSMLERSMKEASFHVHQLKGLQKKHEDQGKDTPSQMKQALGFYENIVAKCGETIPKLKNDFDEQMTLVKSGRSLSEIPAVFVPPPPPSFPPSSLADTKPTQPEDRVSKSSPVEIPPSNPPNNSAGLSSISVKGPVPQTSMTQSIGPPPGLQPQINRPQIPRLANKQAPQTNGQPKNSFEKLLQRLTVLFPQYNRATFTQLIQQLRQSRGGSLSGLTIDEIIQQVSTMIQTHEQKKAAAQQVSSSPTPVPAKPAFPGVGPSKQVAPPPGLNTSWGFTETTSTSAYKGEELFEEEQDPCVICHEEMTPDTTVKLECHHRFHDECIRKWLRENSTCPNCRIYALLPDEFPTLN